jgi:Nif-specific regulatory protein
MQLLGEVAELIAKAVHMRAIEEENRKLKNIIGKSQRPSDEIIGNSKTMKEVFGLVSQVADSNTTVLIHGETGTGKELVARAIHKNSPRAMGPFIEVNCAAMPDTLIESELFGHEKGAFTGANQKRRGRFEEATGGTIFLDEVGELSQLAQVKLLRVIQERQFQPLGSNAMVKVNVRIIAATNRDLDQDVAAGKFRADLYYRLNVFPIYMPSLRERGGDIILLADYFVEKYSKQFKKSIKRISTPAIDLLLAYHWPGNVRELENSIERGVLIASHDTLDSVHLPPSLQMKMESSEKKEHGKLASLVNVYERSLIIDAMKDAKGNQSQAARILGTTKRIIQYKVEKYGIDTKRFKTKKA